MLLFIPNLQQGGAERQILELMTKLPPRFETTLCVYEDVVHYREYLPAGEPRHVLGVRRMGPRGLARLVAVLEQERPDILHSYRDKANFWARLAARRVPVPVVVTAVRSRAMSLFHLLTEWHLSKQSDRVIANSEGVRRELVTLARVRPDKIQVLHNFIDLDKFHPPSEAERQAARGRWGLGATRSPCCCPVGSGSRRTRSGWRSRWPGSRGRGAYRRGSGVLLAGRKRDRLYAAILPRLLSSLGLADRVTFLGPVSEMVSPLPCGGRAGLAVAVGGAVQRRAGGARLWAAGGGVARGQYRPTGARRRERIRSPDLEWGRAGEALGRIIALSQGERRALGLRGGGRTWGQTFGPERIPGRDRPAVRRAARGKRDGLMCGIAGRWRHGATRRRRRARRSASPPRWSIVGRTAWPVTRAVRGAGHRRLSIIDLSEAGRQPMTNEDGQIAIVVNGEIYNHAELRTDLEAKGHRFRSGSDSEVVAHLYEEVGARVPELLRGCLRLPSVGRTHGITPAARARSVR